MDLEQRNGVKVQLHKFRETEWKEVLTGELLVDLSDNCVKIKYQQLKDSLPMQFPEPYLDNERIVWLPMKKIRQVEKAENDGTILYFWVGIQPIAISFLNPHACDLALKKLATPEIQEVSQLGESEEISMEYIQHCLEGNPAMLTILFSNNKSEVLDFVFKGYKNILLNGEPSQSEKVMFFNIIKNAIKLSDRQMIQKMVRHQNFSFLLNALRANTFNDKNFDYWEVFKQIFKGGKFVQIEDDVFLEAYEENAKIRFLKDCAACMFTEIDTDRNFNNIINDNNVVILRQVGQKPQILDQIVCLASSHPQNFVNIICELWEIHKNFIADYDNQWVKERFKEIFIHKNIHNLLLQAASSIVFGEVPYTSGKTPQNRFHEKWAESLNSFFSSDWAFSQEWICSNHTQKSFCATLLKIYEKSKDQGFFIFILNFIRQLLEPSENRFKCEKKFTHYIFQNMIGKIWPLVGGNMWLVDHYNDFLIKIYKIELIRTRRVIIQSDFLHFLDRNMARKSILVCIIKVLQCFLEAENFDVFRYLINNSLFLGLKNEYLRNVKCSNMISSCFLSLLNTYRHAGDATVQDYFTKIFIPNSERNEEKQPSIEQKEERITV